MLYFIDKFTGQQVAVLSTDVDTMYEESVGGDTIIEMHGTNQRFSSAESITVIHARNLPQDLVLVTSASDGRKYCYNLNAIKRISPALPPSTNSLLYLNRKTSLIEVVGDIATIFTSITPPAGGGEDLAATLALGNITGGANIQTSDGDKITAENGNSMIDLRYQGVDDLWVISNEATKGVGTFTISNTLGTGEITDIQIQVGVGTSLQLTFSAVPFNTSIQQTALDLISNINSNSPPNDYVAEIITDIGGVITIRITSPSSTGVSPGFGNFTSIVTGDMTVTSVSVMTNTPTYEGYIIGQPTNSGESLLLGYNPYDQLGIKCERNLVSLGALDSGAPATYVTLTPAGVGVLTEANWLPINPIPSSSILIINAIASNRSMKAIQGMAVMINTGGSGFGNESTYNSGVIRSVVIAGQGITAKTDDTLYTNQISLQPSGNTFDGLLVPPALSGDQTYTFQDASGTVAFLSDISGGGYIQTATTVNATPFLLTSSKAIANGTVQSFVTRVTAISTVLGNVWCHEFRGAIKQFGGVTSIVDTVTDEMIAEDVATAAWGAAITAVPGSMSVTVTGAAVDIKWKAETTFSEIVI